MKNKLLTAIGLTLISHMLYAQQFNLEQPVHSIDVHGSIELTVAHDPNHHKIVPDPQAKMEHVVIQHQPDGTLHLHINSPRGFMHQNSNYKLRLYTPYQISRLQTHGSSRTSLDGNVVDVEKTTVLTGGSSRVTLQSEQYINALDIETHGSSRVQLQTHANQINVLSSGSSQVDGKQAFIKKAYVRKSGSAKVFFPNSVVMDSN